MPISSRAILAHVFVDDEAPCWPSASVRDSHDCNGCNCTGLQLPTASEAVVGSYVLICVPAVRCA